MIGGIKNYRNALLHVFGGLCFCFLFLAANQVQAAEETRTITTFIHQDSAVRPSGQQSDENFDFTFVMTDDIVDIKNAFFDVSGISAVHSGQTLHLSLDDDNTDDVFDFDESTAKTYTLDSTGGPTPFHLIYNVTNVMATSGKDCYVNTRGTYDCTLSFRADNANVYALSIKLTATYRFKPPGTGGGLPAIGYYESPIFNSMQTGETSGIKSGFHNLNWTETNTGSQRIKFQIASCDSVTGTTCNDAGGWVYRGRDGGTATYYGFYESNFSDYCSGSSGTYNCRISFDHYNKRYFRYKITLCSASDCSTSGVAPSPGVNKVILNWSP